MVVVLFFFNDTATTEIYTLSLHDALPISAVSGTGPARRASTSRPRPWRSEPANVDWVALMPADPVTGSGSGQPAAAQRQWRDRKSTRLNSSHANISYAVFCLKKKNQHRQSHDVDASRDLLTPAAELAAGVQLGEHDLGVRLRPSRWIELDCDAPVVVGHLFAS